MKTIYLKCKKSGNYEFCDRKEATIKFQSLKEFRNWFENILSKEKSNTFDRHNCTMKKAQIIKATYRLSQTYCSLDDALAIIKNKFN